MSTNVLAPYKGVILVLSTLVVTCTSLLLFILLRLAQILPTPTTTTNTTTLTLPRRPPPSPANSTHLLVVLGSGGHTAEMLNILSNALPDLPEHFTRRTYLVSSGDAFSASKAVEFERSLTTTSSEITSPPFSVVTVRRARRVHQSWLSTPWTTLLSLWDCISVLRGTHSDFAPSSSPTSSAASPNAHVYPDLILTNGPGTGVCVVLAALLLKFFGYGGGTGSSQNDGDSQVGAGQMRTIFIESWARVRTLSLSGKILRPVVNRFLVQWPQLVEMLGEGSVEYIGPLVS